jgi:hypothetical protein
VIRNTYSKTAGQPAYSIRFTLGNIFFWGV